MFTGYLRVDVAFLERLENALTVEGFDSNIFQVWKEEQIWGGAKLLDENNEIHVRIILVAKGPFQFLKIDSEIEVPRDYVEHLSMEFKAEPYFGPVQDILRRHGIPYSVAGFLPADPVLVKRPVQKTPWKPLLGVGILLGAIFLGSSLDW